MKTWKDSKQPHKTLTNKLMYFKHATWAIHAASAVINTNLAALNEDIQNLHNKSYKKPYIINKKFLSRIVSKTFKRVICSGSWSDCNPSKYLKMG